MESVYSFLCDYAAEGKNNKVNVMGIFDRLTIKKNSEFKYVQPNSFFLVLKMRDFIKGDSLIVKLRPKTAQDEKTSIEVINSSINDSAKENSLGGILILPIKANSEFSESGEWIIQVESSGLFKPLVCGVFQVVHA